MEKTLSIKIDNKGHQIGTVGWLLENADHIKIGKTKNDDQGAWLRDKDDKTICPLVIRNWYDDGKLVVVETLDSDGHGYALMLNFYASDACYRKIKEIAEEVEERMVELFEADSDTVLRVEIRTE